MEPSYRMMIEAIRGSLPLPCDHCGKPITTWGRRSDDGCVHHIDGNHDNDDPANLAVLHARCHTAHHIRTEQYVSRLEIAAEKRRAWWTPERRAAQAERMKGKKMPPSHSARMSAAYRGVPKSAGQLAKTSASLRVRVRCPDCEYESTKQHVSRHRRIVHGVTPSS